MATKTGPSRRSFVLGSLVSLASTAALGWTHGTPAAPPTGHLLNGSGVVLVDNSGNNLLAG
jgi:hypothetical protein